MNKSRVIGIGLIIIGIVIQFLFDETLIQITAGAICAIGLGYLFNWIPLKKKD